MSALPLVGRVLPAGVVCVERFDDVPEGTLLPSEVAVVARAVEKRRREFATVRHCAREALTRLGYPPVPLLPGERGAPQWPDGVVGSMTHCHGYRAAAAARFGSVHAIGIDAEPAEPLPEGVPRLVVRPEEASLLAELARRDPQVPWDRLLFSAKESVYKAWYPLARRWLDFHEASVTIFADGRFEARLLVPGPVVAGRPLSRFMGRWLASDGLVVTGIGLLAAPVTAR